MSTYLGKLVFGTNGHVGTDTNGCLGKWALWGQMSTLKPMNFGANGHLGENGHQEK